MLFSIFLCIGLFTFNAYGSTQSNSCKTPLGEEGRCVDIFQCKPIMAIISKGNLTHKEKQFVANLRCGSSNEMPKVCCSLETKPFTRNHLIPDEKHCGWQADNKIFGGKEVELDTFPWMAVIQYKKPNREKIIACGGTLINRRYVLTAAHCVDAKAIMDVGIPIKVRLGEHNISSPVRDCVIRLRKKYCNEKEMNIKIMDIILHPDYKLDETLHDVALVKLKRKARYSDYVQPICLPEPLKVSETGDLLIVAGWGATEKNMRSDVKLAVKVPVVENAICSEKYEMQLTDSQICAGGEEDKDSCQGDSGGPLMGLLPTDKSRWMIEGIVAYGNPNCGIKSYPAIYTKVAKYVSWIYETVTS